MSQLSKKVYQLLTRIPTGKVTTYKALSQAAGTKAYRAVGQILKKNPDAPTVPCHRVVKTDLTLGGYIGKTRGEALQKKKILLKKEGVLFTSAAKINPMSLYFFQKQ
ncbi:MGMT family protein [Candidatus Roizmanbacteria bacterium]|nr:MGMT family protein [Candidatus Roizmanbacteria bacterium]